MLRKRSVPVVAAMLALTLGLAGCGGPGPAGTGGRLRVVAAFYPLQFLAERAGGDRVQVGNLTKPGAEPHDLELSAAQVASLADADLVLYLSGFQSAVDESVGQEARGRSLDVATVQPLTPAAAGVVENPSPGAKDPHVWLDPVRFAAIGDAVAERLAAADATDAAEIRRRGAALHADLDALDREYAAGLANCGRHEIVTSHAAFGYLASRYHLRQIAITGLSPEEEPTPDRLAQVAKLAREQGVTTIFFETLVSPKIAQTLATEVGAKAEVLDPIEGLEPGAAGDYLSVMRDNLTRLRTALACP